LRFSFKIPVSIIVLPILLSIVYGLIELSYKLFIQPRYFYMGFNWEPNVKNYAITKFIFLCLLLFLNYLKKRSSFLLSIYLLLLFFFYIPNATLFALGNYSPTPFWANVFFITVFLFAPLLKYKLPTVTTPENFSAFFVFMLPLLAILPIAYTFQSQINTNTLLLKDIYVTRDAFSAKIAGLNNYLYNFLAKTFIPIALVYFLIKRKTILIWILVAMLLYLFLISGNKIVYLTTILLLLFYYSGRTYEKKLTTFFVLLIAALICFPLIDLLYLPEPLLTGVFVNRFLFIPALLTQDYFDFFSGKPLLFAETHFLNFFSTSPYNKPIGFIISEVYFNAPDSFANNGIVSDGFMNLGNWGVAIFSILFTLIFSLFNNFKLHVGYFGLFFSYIYILLSAPFFTCLITGGILVFIFYGFTLLSNTSNLAQK